MATATAIVPGNRTGRIYDGSRFRSTYAFDLRALRLHGKRLTAATLHIERPYRAGDEPAAVRVLDVSATLDYGRARPSAGGAIDRLEVALNAEALTDLQAAVGGVFWAQEELASTKGTIGGVRRGGVPILVLELAESTRDRAS